MYMVELFAGMELLTLPIGKNRPSRIITPRYVSDVLEWTNQEPSAFLNKLAEIVGALPPEIVGRVQAAKKTSTDVSGSVMAFMYKPFLSMTVGGVPYSYVGDAVGVDNPATDADSPDGAAITEMRIDLGQLVTAVELDIIRAGSLAAMAKYKIVSPTTPARPVPYNESKAMAVPLGSVSPLYIKPSTPTGQSVGNMTAVERIQVEK